MTGAVVDNTHPALAAFWHPAATSEELGRDPLAVTLLGRRYALARIDGGIVAFVDQCPHRLAPLSAGTIEGDRLRCAYHGYAFGADGACVDIPAQDRSVPIPTRAACGRAAAVTERYGLVWIAPEPPAWPLPEIAEWDEPATQVFVTEQTWHAGAAQMTDNFLDVAHFPFTHRGSFGDASDRVVLDYSVVRSGWSFVARHVHQARHVEADGSYGAYSERIQEYTYTPPHAIHLRLTHPAEGTRSAMAFFMQPVDAATTRLWVLDLHCDLLARGVDAEQLRAARLQVATEDRDLLERFPHTWMPLDLQAEVHTKADRITVELRRVLREIVGIEPATAATG